MIRKLGPLQLSLVLLAICVGILALLEWKRRTADTADQSLLRRLPVRNAAQFYINVGALRDAGLLELLAGSKAAEETDYRNFVTATGFDYRSDLDAILGSFQGERSFFLLRGRFDWNRIRTYATAKKAACLNGLCSTPIGPGRTRVSFFAMHPSVLALAIAPDRSAASLMYSTYEQSRDFKLPQAPVWVSMPVYLAERSASLPTGAKAFADALKGGESLILSLDSGRLGLEARLTITCERPEQAAAIRTELERVTLLLTKMIAREKQAPNPRDLSGVLTAGTFAQKDRQVLGAWPIQRAFLESLAEGNY